MRVLKAGWEMMAGGIDQSPGPRGGGELEGDTGTATPYWSDRMRFVTEVALTFGSKLSLTSHLSILAEDALLVAVCVNSLARGCRHLKASCKPKACCKGSRPDWKPCWRVPG